MKTFSICCLLPVLTATVSYAQSPLSGVINRYAQVLAIDSCAAALTVDDTTGFQPGDPVLLMQLKGAQIDASNSAAFGQLLDIGGAGRFERNEILAVDGSSLTLRYHTLYPYDPAQSVQLVSFPLFQDAYVEAPLLAAPWDGQTGGVLALQVHGTLTLAADLDVSAAGFRGGQVGVVNSGCNFLVGISGYYYNAGNWRGAAKGEGVAEFIPGREHGRGAQANGGGGGNDHNTGGGGGSLLAIGGQGGEQASNTPFGCQGEFPGRGGKSLQGFGDRLFPGGGGGAGHTDDIGAGSGGGRGGGIVILLADTIITANGPRTISADGQSPGLASGDGAGGGGGGGMVWVGADFLAGELSVSASGGQGGHVANSANRCFGPGGGGGGGLVRSNLPNLLSVQVAGGSAGLNTVASGQCSSLSNGAMPGTDGSLLGQAPLIPGGDIPFQSLGIGVPPSDTTVCVGDPASFVVAALGSFPLQYQWQVDDGGGWSDIPAASPAYAGIQSDSLVWLAAFPAPDGLSFRCRIWNACGDTLFSPQAVLTVLPDPQPSFGFQIDGTTVSFSNSAAAATGFLWDFGDGATSLLPDPVHTYAVEGTYLVSLTAWSVCDTVVFDTFVQLVPALLAGFTVDGNPGGCLPLTLVFRDTSSGAVSQRSWSFSGGAPTTSSDSSVAVTYLQPGVFDVGLIVAGPGGTDSLLREQWVTVVVPPAADFEAQADGLTVTFSNLSQGGTAWYWDFGDGNASAAEQPVHTYAVPGSYMVTLAAYNDFCGNALARELSVSLPTPSPSEPVLPGIRVFPNPAHRTVYVEVADSWPDDSGMARLVDALGREMRTFVPAAGLHALPVDDLPAGMYWLVVPTTAGARLQFPIRLSAD